MQALRIHGHGGPDVLRVEDVPTPEAGPGQVLVRVLGVSINHLDLWVRRGMPGLTIGFPRILGCDGTGEIVALGPGVRGVDRDTALQVGQLVVLEPGFTTGPSKELEAGNDHLASDYSIRGEHADGFAAEYVALDANYCLPLPAGVDPVQAAAVPLVFLTAWGMLISRARLVAGETVLVLGGASGVGSAAIQIAKDRGARVLATAGSESKRALAQELGADEVIDHRDEGWGKEVARLTDRRGVDVVFEHVGPATWKSSMSCMAPGARLVTCGGTTGPKVELLLPHLFIKNLTVMGSTMGPRSVFPEIFERIASGAFRPVVDRVMPMSAARDAHVLLEDRAALGKIVLTPGS